MALQEDSVVTVAYVDDSLAATGFTTRSKFEEAVIYAQEQGFDDDLLWRLKEAQSDFSLWGRSWGLLRTGHSSLDYRFRKAPVVFDHTREILLNIQYELSKFGNTQRSPNLDDTGKVDFIFEDGSSDDDNATEITSESPVDLDTAGEETQTTERATMDWVEQQIRMLYHVSSAIQSSKTRIRPDTCLDLVPWRLDGQSLTSQLEHHLIRRVVLEEGWPDMAGWLMERFRDSNSARRAIFQQWRAKFDKRESIITVLAQSKQSHIKTPQSLLRGNSQPVPAQSPKASTFHSQPSSLAKLTFSTGSPSVKSVKSDSEVDVVGASPLSGIPAWFRKEHVEGKQYFTCPYCCIPLSSKVAKGRLWKEHVLNDLHPYICLHIDFPDPLELYSDIDSWNAHELAHDIEGSESQREVEHDFRLCLICGLQSASSVHIAGHLEAIALLALPAVENELPNDETSVRGSDRSIRAQGDCTESTRSGNFDPMSAPSESLAPKLQELQEQSLQGETDVASWITTTELHSREWLETEGEGWRDGSDTAGIHTIEPKRSGQSAPLFMPSSSPPELDASGIESTATEPNTLIFPFWSWVRGMYEKCLEHDDMPQEVIARQPGSAWRLLYLDISADKSMVQLRHIDQYPTNVKYAALSFCWGTEPIEVRLTAANMGQLEEGLPLTYFPSLFQDAFKVCNALSIYYMWIDAVCIMQDSHPDWEIASKSMYAVYANASVTISTENTPNEHILDTEDHPIMVRGASGMDGVTRSWMFLEYTLSQRVLRFDDDTPVWDCRQECSAYNSNERHSMSYHIQLEKPQPLHEWHKTRRAYSKTSTIAVSDRQVALAPIANMINHRLQSKYMFGLFLKYLGFELCWYAEVKRTDRYTEYPTWSWLSSRASVASTSLSDDAIPLVSALDYERWVSTDNESYVSNRSLQGTLKLNGQLMAPPYFTLLVWQSLDIEDKPLSTEHSIFLPIAKKRSRDPTEPMEPVYALVLSPVADRPKHFQRDGLAYVKVTLTDGTNGHTLDVAEGGPRQDLYLI